MANRNLYTSTTVHACLESPDVISGTLCIHSNLWPMPGILSQTMRSVVMHAFPEKLLQSWIWLAALNTPLAQNGSCLGKSMFLE